MPLQPAQRIAATGSTLYLDVYGTLSKFDLFSGEGSTLYRPEPLNEVEQRNRVTNRHAMEMACTASVCVTCCDDKKLRIYRASTGDILTKDLHKRASCITIAGDIIAVGDRFGDVYTYDMTKEDATEVDAQAGEQEQDEEESSETPLLGHVSIISQLKMLRSSTHPRRHYIVTADRDEHVRVSRYPQAHVIEHFLLGHTKFVSSLWVPGWRRDLLVSFGADEFAIVWVWEEGKEAGRLDLSPMVSAAAEAGTSLATAKVVELPGRKQLILIADDVPSLFLVNIADDCTQITNVKPFDMAAPPLDIDIACDGKLVIVALDTREVEGVDRPFEVFSVTDGDLENVSSGEIATKLNTFATVHVDAIAPTRSSNLGLMRKKTKEELDAIRAGKDLHREQRRLAREAQHKAMPEKENGKS
ncbi:tRNA (guanine-N(7)-)-methyltransferase non-catalytic subunit trm82 [Savitreella phatthalungensis]